MPQNLFQQPYLYWGPQLCLNYTEMCDAFETQFATKQGSASATVGFVQLNDDEDTTKIGSLTLSYQKNLVPYMFLIDTYENTVDQNVFKIPAHCQ